jgi:NADH:ubiquinone oxidoreductase subunit K
MKMNNNEAPIHIGVEKIVENEDGSATYTFHMSDAAAEEMQALGLKMILYCGVTRTDIEDVFEWILEQGPGED